MDLYWKCSLLFHFALDTGTKARTPPMESMENVRLFGKLRQAMQLIYIDNSIASHALVLDKFIKDHCVIPCKEYSFLDRLRQ